MKRFSGIEERQHIVYTLAAELALRFQDRLNLVPRSPVYVLTAGDHRSRFMS